MAHKKKNRSNPLSIIALFTAMVEASALACLPFLDENNQTIYLWFLVGFPTFLAVLFFATLNFNYKALYSPSDFETSADFIKSLDHDTENLKNPMSRQLLFSQLELHVIDATNADSMAISSQLQHLVAALGRRSRSARVLILVLGPLPPLLAQSGLTEQLARIDCYLVAVHIDDSTVHFTPAEHPQKTPA